MTRSMTAFARAEHGAAVWELRSVNHRYLDVSFRVPDNTRALEPQLKAQFKDRVHRGKIECSLRINAGELPVSLVLNEPLVKQLNDALDQIQSMTGIEQRGDAVSLMRWPDIMLAENTGDQLKDDIISAFQSAVTALVAMREREGEELAKLIEARLKDIETTVDALRVETPLIIKAQHEKLHKKVSELDLEVDPARLEQELVILAQKLDVAEELDRLLTHVTEVRRNLDANEPVGRRLDFLMQELNREANTLSSKASASKTTLKAVDLKVVIEQMREQIQNIE